MQPALWVEKQITRLKRWFLFFAVLFVLFLVHSFRPSPKHFDRQYENWAKILTEPFFGWNPADLGPVPSPEDQALLKRLLPDVFISPNGTPPMDFYRDILPYSVLCDAKGRVRFCAPSVSELKSSERNPGWFLDFRGKIPCRGWECRQKGYTAPLYGRVFRETLRPPPLVEGETFPVVILKYSAVFPQSGLPARLPWWKEFGAHLLGDPENWHELDIHGAVHLFLREGETEPFAVLFAQHNHFRSYLFGVDLPPLAGKPLCVNYAERSNEPYPCPERGPIETRAAASPREFPYVLAGGPQPLAAGLDVVRGPRGGGVALPTRLEIRPEEDPLFTAWIHLGERKKLFGILPAFYRAGPPGMDLNTWPELSRYTDMLQFWYFAGEDKESAELWKKHVFSFEQRNLEPILRRGAERFHKALKKLPAALDKPSGNP